MFLANLEFGDLKHPVLSCQIMPFQSRLQCTPWLFHRKHSLEVGGKKGQSMSKLQILQLLSSTFSAMFGDPKFRKKTSSLWDPNPSCLETKTQKTGADHGWTGAERRYSGRNWLGQGYPQIIHFSEMFPYEPTILGYPHLWKPHILNPPKWWYVHGIHPQQSLVFWKNFMEKRGESQQSLCQRENHFSEQITRCA